MTPDQFKRWRQHMAGPTYPPLTDRATAKLLGCSVMSVRHWSTDREAPLYVALACTALASNLKPWGDGKEPWR